ncbi:MAG: AMP-binding protein [Actinomycetota bacterium]|nr:AMP-binding protein [Actinomycetota bacterium]
MNFVSDVLERYPASRPALLTIDSEGIRQVWHFGELIAMSAGVSGALAARGVGRGDVVMTLLGNRIEWVLTLLACWRMGAVALPMSTQLRAKDLELRVGAANPVLCVGEPELLGGLPEGVETIDLDEFARVLDEDRPQETPAAIADLHTTDPALVVFTSGTTGEPRGALHDAGYLSAQRSQAENWLGARKGDLVWCTTATGWSKSARNVFVAPWLCGGAALISDARFEADARLALVESEGVNVLCQAPTEYRMLAKRAELHKLPELRRMVSAGEPLNPEVIRVFREAMDLDIHDGYGQTETGHVVGSHVGVPLRDGSMGKPLAGLEIRVDAADGEPGELQVRADTCPTFFDRYLGESREDARARLVDGEWWPTGDVVRRDADGYLFYEGRDDDLILSAGYRIGPFEVESALLSHPAVAEAAAVSAPDDERGAVVRAVVVLRNGEPTEALATELRDHVKSVTAPYKAPRIVDFTDELPKTASGKIRRAELRSPTEAD